MSDRTIITKRWKTPDDLKDWLAKRFVTLVAAALRDPGITIEPFRITTPKLSARFIADQFSSVRSWAARWQDFAGDGSHISIVHRVWDTQKFGRVTIPKSVTILSIDSAAALIRRTQELAMARLRFSAIVAIDHRYVPLADQWPAIVAMSEGDFSVLCRFLTAVPALDPATMRLREVRCPGMHTKFLEQHRSLLKPILAALDMPGNAKASSPAGQLGFIEDDRLFFELRDLDGGLLPFDHFALPLRDLMHCPFHSAAEDAVAGIVIVENLATFHALPSLPGIIGLFGQGNAVRSLGQAPWLRTKPILYMGDLDHAGYQMVAGLRRDGLQHLTTTLMDLRTAETLQDYWVEDTSYKAAEQIGPGLTSQEIAAQQQLAKGPWRLEQERIPFDLLVAKLQKWRHSC